MDEEKIIEEKIVIEKWGYDKSPRPDRKELLEQYGCHCILLFSEGNREVCLGFVTVSEKIRAVEFMDFIIGEFALINGDADMAEAKMSTSILKTCMKEYETEDIKTYLEKRIQAYFRETNAIIAKEYKLAHMEEIQRMPQYRKKKIDWACVKTLDIAPAGEQLFIKSLENEEGEVITAGEDTYIMIGCRGEVYQIAREKFETTYELKSEQLDIFEKMFDYIPEVKRVADGQYISIDENAVLCQPRSSATIHAAPLKQRTKIFPEKGEYFLGRAGDYMAIRTDDLTDVYIIQKGIFEETYEKI